MSLHQGRHRAGEGGRDVVDEGRHRAPEAQPPVDEPSDQRHRPEGHEHRVARDVVIPALHGASGTLAAVALAALVLAGPGEPGAWLALPPPFAGPSADRPADPGDGLPGGPAMTPADWEPGPDGWLGRSWTGGWVDVLREAAGLAASCGTVEAGGARVVTAGMASAVPAGGRASTAASAAGPAVVPAGSASAGTGGSAPSPVGAAPPPASSGTGPADEPPGTGQPATPSSPVGRIVEPVTAAAEPVTQPVQTRVVDPVVRAAEPVTPAAEPVTEAVETAVVEPVTEAAQPVTETVESVTETVPVLPDPAGDPVGETVGSLPVGLP